jgi:hypothetical protein
MLYRRSDARVDGLMRSIRVIPPEGASRVASMPARATDGARRRRVCGGSTGQAGFGSVPVVFTEFPGVWTPNGKPAKVVPISGRSEDPEFTTMARRLPPLPYLGKGDDGKQYTVVKSAIYSNETPQRRRAGAGEDWLLAGTGERLVQVERGVLRIPSTGVTIMLTGDRPQQAL